MARAQRLVGIDFGTSTSVVRIKRYQDGKPIGDNYSSSGVTFGNGEGDTKASTLVRRNADGSFTCGAEAEESMPSSTVFREFKMHLESQDSGAQAQARELTAAFFHYLYGRYDHQRSDLGEIDDEERTLVSLPVKWREETRQFMARTAEEAGFKQVAIMDEPTAALYAALCRKMSEINQQGLLRTGEPGYMLLVDMGAGTTDLAVCRYTLDSGPGEVIRADRIKNEIVATWPEDRNAATFGGREVDRVLEDYVQAFLTGCGLPEPMAAQFVRGSGTSAAKRWKENSVSKLLNEGKQVETCAFIANVSMLLPQQNPFPAFGRSEFERMLGDKLVQFKGLVAGCLQRASEAEPEVLAKGLDLVILTGGHSSWYFTEELLNGTMPGLALPQLERVQREKARVIRLTNPQETVALGLVYSALPFTVQEGKEASPEVKKAPQKQEMPEEQAEKAPLEPAKNGPEKTSQPFGSAAEIAMEVQKEKAESVPASAEELLGIWAKDFIDHYDASVMKVMRRKGLLPIFRSLAHVRSGDIIYLEHNGSLDHTGSIGFVICRDGIHYCNGIRWNGVLLWSRLLEGTLMELKNGEIKIDFRSGKPEHVTPRLYSFDKLYHYRHECFRFFCELQACLRNRLAEYRRHN